LLTTGGIKRSPVIKLDFFYHFSPMNRKGSDPTGIYQKSPPKFQDSREFDLWSAFEEANLVASDFLARPNFDGFKRILNKLRLSDSETLNPLTDITGQIGKFWNALMMA